MAHRGAASFSTECCVSLLVAASIPYNLLVSAISSALRKQGIAWSNVLEAYLEVVRGILSSGNERNGQRFPFSHG
jgi:hypothetical protein